MRRLVAILVFCTLATNVASTQVLATLVNFDNSNGAFPASPLLLATDGNFYGVTTGGGRSGYGTIFKITPDGSLTTVHSFDAYVQSYPVGALIQASDGNMYGTTQGGDFGGATVFKLTPDYMLTTLHTLLVQDGTEPKAPLVQGRDGILYGTASTSGANNRGTVFKVTLGGAFTNLHNFNAGTDGAAPQAGLVQGADGNFYGTTSGGFDSVQGTVFRITPDGRLTTLYSFGGLDGARPLAGLAQFADGSFYGTTIFGGANDFGTVFKITPGGALTTLHNFNYNQDGVYPNSTLVQAADGNFYGTTYGSYPCSPPNCGTIFQMTPQGTVTTLYAFNLTDGLEPVGLVQAADGTFYGATASGGAACYDKAVPGGPVCYGTIYRFDSGLFPILSVTKLGSGTVSGGGGHIYCGSACGHSYPKGTQITLSELPAPGNTFTGWTGCDQVNGSYCSVTMTSAKNITATFTPANVTLSLLSFKPSYVRGGQLSAGTLTLSGPAPQGGVSVALSSDHPGVAHPPSFVFIPGGKGSVQFAVNTFPVKSTTTVTITATAGASHVSGTLMVGTIFAPPAVR